MAASVLVGRILIIEPIGTVPARLYVAKGLVLTIWDKEILRDKKLFHGALSGNRLIC